MRRQLKMNLEFIDFIGHKYLQKIFVGLLCSLFAGAMKGQTKFHFTKYSFDSPKTQVDKIFITKEGGIMILNSSGVWRLANGKPIELIIGYRDFHKNNEPIDWWHLPKVRPNLTTETRECITQGIDSTFYFIT